MIFRELDSNGDWLFGKGINNYLRNNAAIGMNIKTRVLSWLNDCFFDLPAGIDWVNRLGNKNQKELLEAELKSMILKSEGVTGLNSIDVYVTERKFTASYSVNTIFSAEYQNQVERSY